MTLADQVLGVLVRAVSLVAVRLPPRSPIAVMCLLPEAVRSHRRHALTTRRLSGRPALLSLKILRTTLTGLAAGAHPHIG
jgi:hypothetical protein